jgi:UDP-hydrolysing UDP-N-acetyl-D-glucosamine 2-epimerase
VRRIAIVTVARSDYSYWKPVLEELKRRSDAVPLVLAGSAHFSSEFGDTVQVIEADGWKVDARIDTAGADDSPAATARAIGTSVESFARAYAALKPDVIGVLGDRYEMFAAAAAAVPLGIPLAHVAGGERTDGAIDDSFRHAMTKLSQLHFVAHEDYARRVIQMGEETWRVTISGAPTLDNLRHLRLLTKKELENRFGLDLSVAPCLVTYHPVTRELESAAEQTEALLGGLKDSGLPCVFTAPNADPSYRDLLDKVSQFVASDPRHRLVRNFGTVAYYSMMKHAAMMVGNSSSGIIESSSFRLPVVNVGERQAGRLKPENVIDADNDRSEIVAAIRRATISEFRRSLDGLVNPYGDGHAAERIVERLMTVPLGPTLMTKRFVDAPQPDAQPAL